MLCQANYTVSCLDLWSTILNVNQSQSLHQLPQEKKKQKQTTCHSDYIYEKIGPTVKGIRKKKKNRVSLSLLLLESQNDLGWNGPQRSSSSRPPAAGRITNGQIKHQIRLPGIPSNLAMNIHRDRAPTSSQAACSSSSLPSP